MKPEWLRAVRWSGKLAEGEAGEEAEGAVEGQDQGTCDEAAEAGVWDGELRDQPSGLGEGRCAEGCGEGLDLGGGEAVEEEVGHDEVVRRVWGAEGAGIGVVSVNAGGVVSGPMQQGVEHGGAGIDGVNAENGSGAKQAGGEAAIAIAEDEGVGGGGGFREECACGFARARGRR